MISKVANVWMPVEDIDRSVGFYKDVLGLQVVKRDDEWAELEVDGLRVGLNGREPRGAQIGGGPVLTFEPEGELEAAVENLKERGAEFPAEISEHDWGRVATFKDSEGNDLQLYEPPQN